MIMMMMMRIMMIMMIMMIIIIMIIITIIIIIIILIIIIIIMPYLKLGKHQYLSHNYLSWTVQLFCWLADFISLYAFTMISRLQLKKKKILSITAFKEIICAKSPIFRKINERRRKNDCLSYNIQIPLDGFYFLFYCVTVKRSICHSRYN